MSAPSPAPGDDRPREGYYPDPSIPGYVRYWNGAAWVPGTSRPAPSDGESLDPPPGSGPVPGQAQAPSVPLVEETGPHFFDEDPEPVAPAEPAQGGRPEPASAWGADRSRQSGFGGDQDRRVSWGADPRAGSDGPDRTSSTDGSATIPPARTDPSEADSGGTFVFRRVTADPGPQGGASDGSSATPAPAADEGTMTFRAVSQRKGQQGGAQGGGTGAPAGAGGGARPTPGAGASGGPGGSGPGAQPPSAGAAGATGGPAFGPPASAAAPDAPG
ncbi:DUF2510 domain-containing protein, partial [Streptomyces sp. NPDC058954]|uniref:DUF2510 domain-containing protein n=1 Tax=Streptomyces sp. NPDC058954 TaxID=3346677 RepID=UPI003674219D